LREQRKSAVDEQARALVAERAQTGRKEAAAALAEQEARRHAQVSVESRSAEREELESGNLRAQDLSQAASWEQSVEEARVALARRHEKSARELSEQRAQEARAREALAQADAAADAVDKHQDDWATARQRARDEAEEQSVEEAWLARRFNGQGSGS
jgi:hypothetical protein